MATIYEAIQAVYEGNTRFVTKWLDDNPSIHPDAPELRAQGLTLLYVACLRGKSGVAKALLRAGADINYGSGIADHLRTPLYAAFCGKHYDLMRQLVDMGVDISARYDDGSTILHCALFDDSLKVFQKIVGMLGNLDATDRDGDTTLMVYSMILHPNSSVKHQLEKTKVLLKAGASLSVVGRDGYSPLHGASQVGNHVIVRMLLDAGASVSARSHHDLTALMHAVKYGQLAVVRLLVQAGADIEEIWNGVWEGGGTALMFAADTGQAEIVSFLLGVGASTLPPNGSTHTALAAATESGHPKVARELVRAGADPVFSNGVTALHIAASQVHVDVVRVLLEEGCLEVCVADNGFDICDPACHIGVMIANGTEYPLREQRVRQLLARGPAFCARSWLWPVQTAKEDCDIAGRSASEKVARAGSGRKLVPVPWRMFRHRHKRERNVDIIKILCRRVSVISSLAGYKSAIFNVFRHIRGSLAL